MCVVQGSQCSKSWRLPSFYILIYLTSLAALLHFQYSIVSTEMRSTHIKVVMEAKLVLCKCVSLYNASMHLTAVRLARGLQGNCGDSKATRLHTSCLAPILTPRLVEDTNLDVLAIRLDCYLVH